MYARFMTQAAATLRNESGEVTSMQTRKKFFAGRAMMLLAMILAMGLLPPPSFAKKLYKDEWVITITAPDSATGNHFGVRTFVIHARKHKEPPSPLPLNKLEATAEDGTKVQGVWRQSGKKFSLTFEMPCSPDTVCATVTLRGKFTSKTVMSGKAILLWDTRDRDNVADFETVNGTFVGFKQ